MLTLTFSAPTVTLERIPSGTEAKDATDALLTMYPNIKMAAQVAVGVGRHCKMNND